LFLTHPPTPPSHPLSLPPSLPPLPQEFDLPDLNEEDFANLKTIKDVVTMVEANKK
jgi:hypothetical protein